jgi:hypothetical protein
MLRDGAKKRASSARTDRGKILNLMAVVLGLCYFNVQDLLYY